MAARETMTTGVMRPRHRQRVRNFAIAWTGVTLLFGALSFIAVYAATGIAANAANTTRGLAPVSITTNNDTAITETSQSPSAVPLVAMAQVTATSGQPAAVPATNTQAPAGGNTQPTAVPATAAPATEAPAAAGPTPTIPPIKDTDFDLGIAVQENVDASTYKNWVAMVGEQLKLNWAKEQVVWRDVEKEKGHIDFGALDVSLPMLNQANIKVLLSIAKAPNWARDKGAPTNRPGELDGPPADPQDFVDFVTAIVKKYPGMIHAIEVWNEINLDREWSTAPQRLDPKRYVDLLKAVHDAVKAIDPNIIIVTAALSPTGANIAGKVMDDFTYMKMLIDAGMLQYADCVGAHHNGINVPPTADWNNIPNRPKARYRGPWENPHHSWAFKSTLEGYNQRVKAAGSNLKLCVTEFGWPSTQGLNGQPRQGFEFAGDNSLADQADFTDQAITEMQKWGWVRLAFLWNLNYGAQVGWSMKGPVSDNVVYSILGPDFQPRPVWQKIVDRNFRGQPRKASQ
jgi:hypothetical protein